MIKPINPIRLGKILTTTMLLSGAILTSGAKNNLVQGVDKKDKAQTELVSKDNANAFVSNAVSLETHSFDHNKKLDKLYFKHCEPLNSEKGKRGSLKSIYKVYGTFGGTVELQRTLDSHFVKRTISSYINHFALSQQDVEKVQNIVSKFYEWENDEFFKELYLTELKMYEEQEFPSAEKVISYIDKHIDNSKYFTDDDRATYKTASRNFEAKQEKKNSVQSKSDLLAYKIHIMDALAYKNFFEQNGIPEPSLFMYYFKHDFLNGEAKIRP